MKKQLLSLFIILNTLLVNAQTPQLWGTMQIGGNFGVGTIIKIQGDGTGFETVYSFSSGSPLGNLLPNSSNQLYSMLAGGGINSLGEIFKYDPTLNIYSSLFSFDSLTGFYPRASLYQATDGILYGVTSAGGTENLGTLFSFDPVSNVFSKLHDFDGISGQYPVGNVIQSGNKLYGMTSTGGTNSFGVIFSWDLTSDDFSVAYNLAFSTGCIPFGSFIMGADNKLYASLFSGGSLGYGAMISFDPSNNTFTDLYNFNGTDGSAPSGNPTLTSNGLMYGMTSQGGASNFGVIYSFNPDNNSFNKLMDFDGTNGSKPNGSLMQASDNKLYGTTWFGGADNFGVIFSFDPVNNSFSKLHDCIIASGGFPYADLIEFYAVTGISENESGNRISVYPNPFTTSLSIKINKKNSKDFSVTIKNMLGQIVFYQEKNNLNGDYIKTIDLTSFESGIYFLDVIIDGEHSIMKTVRQ